LNKARLAAAALAALLWWTGMSSHAAFPAAYAPVVVEPGVGPSRTEFDLSPVLARAKQEGKRVYVYLGAHDCGYCRRYEAFLEQNAAKLKPHFARDYIVADLRSSLTVPASEVYIRIGAKSLPYLAFQLSIGDERTRALVYPNVWLLDADAKPLMQMPTGAGTFQTVPEQLGILRLEQ